MLATEAIADPMSGWPSLILQGGAFMLLAYVVIRIAPSMMKDMRDERETRDLRFERVVALLQTSFLERNATILDAIKRQTDSWVDEIRSNTKALQEATRNVCRYPYGPNSSGLPQT